MFYSQFVLTKKGPLAKIWLAAHMQSKLTKAMVFATDLRKAVEKILTPDAPMALRLSSNLLLGVVRIFQRKTKYLLQESSDAMTNLKLTFRPGSAVDLPESDTRATFASITLDAGVDQLAAPNIDLGLIPQRVPKPASAYLAAERDITIDEFAGGLAGGMLDAFALEPELDRADEMDLDLDAQEPLLFTPSQRTPTHTTPSVRQGPLSAEAMRADSADQPAPEPPVLDVTPATPATTTPAPAPDAPSDGAQRPASPASPPDITLHTPDVPSLTPEGVAPATPVRETARLSTGGDELVLAEDDAASDLASTPKTPTVPEGARQDAEAEATPAQDVVAAGETPAREALVDEPMSPSPAAGEPTTQETAAPTQEADTQDAEVEETGSQEGAQDRTQQEPGSPSSPRPKKRKLAPMDEQTELSASQFRACLEDTSDLMRQPRSRRRVGARRGPREPLRYEDLLARPAGALSLAPQLVRLFEQSFRVEEVFAGVGSPMSDADLGEKKGEGEKGEEGAKAAEEKDEEGAEKEAAEATVEGSPEKPTAPDVVEDPDAVKALAEAPPSVAPSSLDARTSSRADVVDEPEPQPIPDTEMTPAGDTSRRLSVDPGAVPVPDEEDTAYAPRFDLSKTTLSDVANTRSQVDNGQSAAESNEVTESTISARTHKMQQYILEHLNDDGELDYSEALHVEPNMTRRTASRSFYELLNLSSKKALQLRQEGAFGRISARPLQPTFDSLATKIVA